MMEKFCIVAAGILSAVCLLLAVLNFINFGDLEQKICTYNRRAF